MKNLLVIGELLNFIDTLVLEFEIEDVDKVLNAMFSDDLYNPNGYAEYREWLDDTISKQ